MGIRRMKKAAIIALYLLGLVQITFGVVVGRLLIYSFEAPFWLDLGRPDAKARDFMHYIDIFKHQWDILTWFGALTLLIAAILTRDVFSRKR